jgi:WD40 repeat protein
MFRGHRTLVAMAVLLLRSVAASQSTYCGETKGTATASCSLQVPIKMWNGPDGPPIIRSLDLSPDAGLIAVGFASGAACAWKVTDRGTDVLATSGPEHPATESVALWDVRMASRARVCAELFEFVDNRLPNPEKSKVRIRLWDFGTKATRTVAEFDDVVPGELGIAPEANFVAFGGGNNCPLRMVECSTGKTVWMDREVKLRVGPVKFSPMGTALAAGIDADVRVYEARTGKLRRKCTGFATRVLSVAFSNDGSRVIGGSSEREVRVWDLENPKKDLVLRLELPSKFLGTAAEEEVAFAPDLRSALAFVKEFSEAGQTASIWRSPLQAKGLQERLLHSDGSVAQVRFAREARIFAMFRNERARSVELWRY